MNITKLSSSFSFIPLTQQEELRGQILNSDQKNILQNLRAGVAEQILNLVVDTTNINKFTQEDAYLKGQLQAFSYLIDCSDVAEQEVLSEAKRSAE